MTWIRSGSTGKKRRMSARVSRETAITRPRRGSSVRSIQLAVRRRCPAAPPSTAGGAPASGWSAPAAPHSCLARHPARCAYQVWQWTTSASRSSLAIARLRWNASRAPPNRGSVPCVASVQAPYPRTRRPGSSRSWSPKQRTSTGTRRASSRLRYSTWTPAPPYTSGGYSLVNNATLPGDDTTTSSLAAEPVRPYRAGRSATLHIRNTERRNHTRPTLSDLASGTFDP